MQFIIRLPVVGAGFGWTKARPKMRSECMEVAAQPICGGGRNAAGSKRS